MGDLLAQDHLQRLHRAVIAQRAQDGNAASADAVQTGAKAGPLAELGWQAAQRYAATRG